ncbi:MAG: 2-phosphosulfolactate phosphatase [Nitrososphaeria archaeon]|nr:2-phosphosulfolactate phosphatase [Aigarchaeota archaeon]MCX8187547.1 2-phosphosulfolactate phosphatase [Nitrososphaeria archaeon]MDW8021508.1 2-phosphosulfolactate phosphatase [Nitrososphaerota archaeon]
MFVEVLFGLPEKFAEAVVVVDVFRSSTSIVTAFENGALSIIPCSSPIEALKLKERLGDDYLLVGEEFGFTPPGFDLNISPLLLTRERVGGRKMIYCSTNLMKVVSRCIDAKRLVIGGLVNSRAVAEYLNKIRPDKISIIACGLIPKNMITLEDVVGAGSIVYKLRYDDASDAALIAQLTYENDRWREIAPRSFIAGYLRQIGWEDDVEVCLREDASEIIPVLEDGELKPVKLRDHL